MPFKTEIIQMNLCHSWMKWINYDLQKKTTKIEFKHDFNPKKTFKCIELHKANHIVLQTSLDP